MLCAAEQGRFFATCESNVDESDESDLLTCQSHLSDVAVGNQPVSTNLPWRLDAFHDSLQKSLKWMRAWRARYFYELYKAKSRRLRHLAFAAWVMQKQVGKRMERVQELLYAKRSRQCIAASWYAWTYQKNNSRRLRVAHARIQRRWAVHRLQSVLILWCCATAVRRRRGAICAHLLISSARRAMAGAWAAMRATVDRRAYSMTPEQSRTPSPPASQWSRRKPRAEPVLRTYAGRRRMAAAIGEWIAVVLRRRLAR